MPCAPVLGLDEVVEDPQFQAVKMLQSDPEGDMRLIGLPVEIAGRRPPFRSGPPALGDANHMLEEEE